MMQSPNTTTHYQLILDASGSMSNVRLETLNAVNRQIEAIRELARLNPDQKIRISLTTFNTAAKKVFQDLRPEKTSLLLQRQYTTEGGTALLDAIGMATSDLEECSAAEDDMVMVIITDGEENSSQFFSFRQIAERIRTLKKTERWTFTFLGADIDAWSVANKLHISFEEVRSFSKDSINEIIEDTSSSLEGYMDRKRRGVKEGFFRDRN